MNFQVTNLQLDAQMREDKLSDAEILRMIRGTSEQRNSAFEWIYKHASWVKLARGILRKKKHQEADIEDAIQNSIIIFDNHIRNFKYEEKGSLKNYFLGICKNDVYSSKRKNKRNIYTEDQTAFDTIQSITPESIMLQNQQKEIINDLLDKIGEPCRSVLKLYRLSYSVKEMAAELSKSEGMMKKLRHTCRKKLSAAINKLPDLFDALNLNK